MAERSRLRSAGCQSSLLLYRSRVVARLVACVAPAAVSLSWVIPMKWIRASVVCAWLIALRAVALLALRRARRWLFNPTDEEVMTPGDVLVLRGIEEVLAALRELAGLSPRSLVAGEAQTAISELDRAIDLLVEMKNVAELAVALAYATVLPAIAASPPRSTGSRIGSTRCASRSRAG
jgi:hypothetical protein